MPQRRLSSAQDHQLLSNRDRREINAFRLFRVFRSWKLPTNPPFGAGLPPPILYAGLRCLLETFGQKMWHGRETGHNFADFLGNHFVMTIRRCSTAGCWCGCTSDCLQMSEWQ